MTVGTVAIFLITWPPIDWLLTRPLEARYPIRPFRPRIPPQAIVVFAASVSPSQFERPYPLLNDETFRRCEYAVWIRNQYPSLPVVVSGGNRRAEEEPYAKAMAAFLQTQGIPANRIWIEGRSLNTFENAAYSAAILRQNGIRQIALVVDASSMLRASRCFRKYDIEVAPAPSGFRELGRFREELFPSWRALRQNEETFHESAGLFWYWLSGRL